METLRQTFRRLFAVAVFALCWGSCSLGQNPRALFPQTARKDSTIRISYLLPIAAKENVEQGLNGESRSLLPFLEFFQGGELALQYWRENGYNIDLQLIDTRSTDTASADEQLRLPKSDLWIGPVYAEEFLPYAELAKKAHKTIVYPLSQMGSVWENNPSVFQVATDNFQLWKNMADQFLTPKERTDTWVFIQANDWKDYAPYLQYLKGLNDSVAFSPHTGKWQKFPGHKIQSSKHPQEHHIRLVTYETGKDPLIIRNNIAGLLNTDNDSRFIILSQDEAFLSDLLEKLNSVADYGEFTIHTFGMPRWNKLESLNSNWFYQLNTFIPSAYYARYDTDLAKRFVTDFMSKHAMDPSPFAIQGFDITNYFIERQTGTSDPRFAPIQSKYKFNKSPEGGYVNSTGFVLEYTLQYEVIAH